MEFFQEGPKLYVNVILPLALRKSYTYTVPEELQDLVGVGKRVEVQFGKNKLYAALIESVTKETPDYPAKPILSVLDNVPIILPIHIKLWSWIASYYCCTKGEVMSAALPASLKLASETLVRISPDFDEDYSNLDDKEYLIAEALSIQAELSIDEIQKILNQRTVYPLINSLLFKRVILLKEELKVKYKPRTVTYVRLAEPYKSDPETLKKAFELIGNRAKKQLDALLGFIQLSRNQESIKRSELCEAFSVSTAQVNEIAKKGIFQVYEKEVSRIGGYEKELVDNFELSAQQLKAMLEVKNSFQDKNVTLLHGVTGSGKTQVYIELIQEQIEAGKQVLYLLPEIGLTAQIIGRLKRVFGDKVEVYHSKLNNNERVEMWHQTLNNKPIVIGARSALFLPFTKLGMIIIDEEHDPSFKQQDPAPRYNARDTAIFAAHLFGAKVLLGTATPSIETFVNAKSGKYGLVEMMGRFGGIKMPEVVIADAARETTQKKMKSHFTSLLLDELREALGRGEQAILFQNRRGYAPTFNCETCGWTAQCLHCDVSLTYHKYANNLRCHYCGYQTSVPRDCNACGSASILVKGFGTEKIEDELKIYLPDAKIARMDWDSVRSKNGHQKIITDFEDKKIDILVGTQMVTKGLDFDNVGLVGVLSADQLFYFPDFRATERAFQLITQVSGRAGRKKKQGKVIVQAFNTKHPILSEIINNDFLKFYEREDTERRKFLYPPYFRLIRITLKHKKKNHVDGAAKLFADYLRKQLGKRVLGPAEPGIPRVRNYYLMDIVIKLERKKDIIELAKKLLYEAEIEVKGKKGLSQTRINVDVDPY